jgi:hypothetical protein
VRKLLFYTALFLLSAVIYAVPLLGRKPAAPGRVSGTVTDAANAVVLDAAVSLLGANGAILRTVRTDAEGKFSFDSLPAAVYVVSIDKPGFTNLRRTISVASEGQTTVDAQLAVSALQTEVTVSAEAGHAADVRTIDQQVNVVNEEEILACAPEVVAQVVDEEPGVNLRNQQDGGRRYDQLLGGDGNLIADLRNLMTDLLYSRVSRQKLGFFDNASFTVSYNGQREERVNQGGQGNPLAAITSQRERTNVLGFNFHIDKQLNERNSLLFGADVYRDKITAPAYTFEPATGITVPSRPRIPNGASYLSYGAFVQNVFTAIPDRLRVSGSLRYSVASYKSEARNAPLGSDGVPLFRDDSARFDAVSGRIGAVLNLGKGFDIAAKYARGFRAPNTTALGIIGLVGTGFEVDARTAAGLGGFIGNASDSTAISTGIPVKPLEPEASDSFDI